MKKLLFISLLFFHCKPLIYSQIVFAHRASGFNTGGIGSIASDSYEAGKLYIIFAGTTNSSTPAVVSLSGGTTTWTEIGNIVSDDGLMRIQAFRFAPSADETTAITVTYTGSQNGGYVQLLEIQGVKVTGTNGSDGIVQVVTDAIDAGTDPSITLAALANRSGVVAGFIRNVNPFGGTAESDYLEQNDGGYATPDTGGYYMTRANAGDNTPTVTAASSNWAGIAIELRAGSRRNVIIN